MCGDALVSLHVVMATHNCASSVFSAKWWRPAVVVLLVRICKATTAAMEKIAELCFHGGACAN